jgi:hypothetical protein
MVKLTGRVSGTTIRPHDFMEAKVDNAITKEHHGVRIEPGPVKFALASQGSKPSAVETLSKALGRLNSSLIPCLLLCSSGAA